MVMRTNLILSRRAGESVELGNDITVTVAKVDGGKVQLHFLAPRTLNIRRSGIPALASSEPTKPRRS